MLDENNLSLKGILKYFFLPEPIDVIIQTKYKKFYQFKTCFWIIISISLSLIVGHLN